MAERVNLSPRRGTYESDRKFENFNEASQRKPKEYACVDVKSDQSVTPKTGKRYRDGQIVKLEIPTSKEDLPSGLEPSLRFSSKREIPELEDDLVKKFSELKLSDAREDKPIRILEDFEDDLVGNFKELKLSDSWDSE